MPLLDIQGLGVRFGRAQVVQDLSLTLNAGEVLALVGESGSGKSVSMQAVLGLLDPPVQVSAQRLNFAGHDLLSLSAKARRRLLGTGMALIAQDPNSALNPSFSIGFQLREVLRQHQALRGHAASQRAIELLDMVEIPAAASRLNAYPYQLSGGMNQRVAIAMALAGNPRLLIADEPTTALDVTVQASIMALLLKLQQQQQMALLLITHDLGLVARYAARASVMYAGQIVENGPLPELFQQPQHPYTEALLKALPEHNPPGQQLASLPGMVPNPLQRPSGCWFMPRCPYAQPLCQQAPSLQGDTHPVRCHFPREHSHG